MVSAQDVESRPSSSFAKTRPCGMSPSPPLDTTDVGEAENAASVAAPDDHYAPGATISANESNDEEGDIVGEWLGGRTSHADLLTSAAASADLGLSCRRPMSPTEVRSTLSSPGKASIRERLRQTLQIEPLQGRLDRSDIGEAISNPPPPPKSPPPPSSPRSQSSHDILASFNRADSEDSDSVLRVQDMSSPGSTESRTNRTRPKVVAMPVLQYRHSPENKENHRKEDAALLRLSRQAVYNRRSDGATRVKANRVQLHIYDLIHDDTIVALPFGCHFPIGECFSAVNNSLHAMGTGAYHCGLEVNGVEYAYGACNLEGATGVFSCIPKHSPGYQFRTTLDFGIRKLARNAWVKSESTSSGYREAEVFVDGREVMKGMASEYLGVDYDLLRRNCCTFARDACLRLGVEDEEIPTWFMNLAGVGAATQDVALIGVAPITSIASMLSMNEEEEEEIEEMETGFEVIAKQKRGDVKEETTMEIVRVVDALEVERHANLTTDGPEGPTVMRRTWSWTY